MKLGVALTKINNSIARETLPGFANIPINLKIDLPRQIINPERIYFGDNVSIGPNSFIFAFTHYPTSSMIPKDGSYHVQYFDSKIMIGNNVSATGALQIAAHDAIVIEDDVMFASNVQINDASHGYDTGDIPYKYQPLTKIASIKIKNGSWIGQNVLINSGVTVGRQTIIGANSIVTTNIPDYCIAVGNPAKVIKKWNHRSHTWDVTNSAIK